MKWSEFKKQVDDALQAKGVDDISILYIDIDDSNKINVNPSGLGLIVSESFSTKPLDSKPADLQQ